MWRVALGTVLVCLVADVATAQQGRRGGGFGRGGFFARAAVEYVGIEAVQTELKATDEQKTKLNEIAAKIRDERQAQRGGGGGGGGQDAAERARRRAEQVKQITATYKPQVAEVLNEDQMKRLQQISWQAMGALALQDEEVVKALGLNEEAQKAIAAAVDEYNANAPGFGQGGGGPEAREERQAQLTKRNDAIMAALSDEQKKKFEELKGEEFDVTALFQGFGRGGGGGRRGGPGGPGGGN